MPYRSKAQQGFFHTANAKKAGITSSDVDEWDKASKGQKDLPEHIKKMADGGEIENQQPQPMSQEDMAALQAGKPTQQQMIANAALQALASGVPTIPLAQQQIQASGIINPSLAAQQQAAMGMANGGEITEPGLQDATVSDFGPALMAIISGGASEAPEAIDALGSTGMAPIADDAAQFDKQDLRELWGRAAQEQSGTSLPAQAAYKRPDSFAPTNMFAKGGEVKPFNGIRMDDGGDTMAALQQLVNPSNQAMMTAMGGQTISNPIAAIPTNGAAAPVMPPSVPPTPPQPDQSFINQLNAGTAIPNAPAPATPNPVQQTSQAAQNIPPTPPSIYQGISAQDRAQLMQQLLAQKSSPGMLAASGAAGLGDAITSAFGKSPTNAQGNLRQAANQNIEQRAGIVDTERQQKMQDVAANMMVMKSDPNSSMSQMARQMYKQMTGKTPPSGISAAQIETLNPLIEKTIETSAQKAIAGGEQAVNAGKALYGETWGDMIKELFGAEGTETGAAALEKASGATPSSGANLAGWSITPKGS